MERPFIRNVLCVVKLGRPSASPAPVRGCSARVRREGVRIAGARAPPAHRAQDRHATSRLLRRTQPPQRPHCTQPVPNVAAAALRGSYPSHGERLISSRPDPWPHAAAAHTRQPCTFPPHLLKIIATTCLDSFPRTGRSGGLPRLPSALLEGGMPHNRGGIVTDLRIYYY